MIQSLEGTNKSQAEAIEILTKQLQDEREQTTLDSENLQQRCKAQQEQLIELQARLEIAINSQLCQQSTPGADYTFQTPQSSETVLRKPQALSNDDLLAMLECNAICLENALLK